MTFRILMVFGLVLCLVVGGIALAPQVSAADFRSGDRVVVAAGEVVDDDMYVTANELVIDGTVTGDVYAFATSITINGTVDHDLNAGAQTIEINGTVGDAARLGAQTIVFGENAQVARTALMGAFSLETKPNSTIGGDVLFGAYQALLAGNIGKDVLAGANGIELRGSVGRNMRVTVGDRNSNSSFQPGMFMQNSPVSVPDVPFGLTIGPAAKIGGDLVYESQLPARVESGSTVTGPVMQQTPVPNARTQAQPVTAAEIQAQQTDTLRNIAFDQARRFLILLLIGLLALWLLPKWIQSLAGNIQTKPLGSLGRGVLMVLGIIGVLIGLVFVMILLALFFGVITLGALAGAVVLIGTVAFGVITVGYWLFTTFIAPVVVSFLLGRLIFGRMQATWAQNRFLSFFVGLILLTLVALIPFVNFIAGVLITLLALGALLLWFSQRMQRPNMVAVAPA